MVRNLWMRNGWPKRPTRSWRNITGPAESSFTHSAISSSSGASINRPRLDSSTSNKRLAMFRSTPCATRNHGHQRPQALRTAAITRSVSASLMRVYSGRLSMRS